MEDEPYISGLLSACLSVCLSACLSVCPPVRPTEPHLPHVLIEDGDMTQEEYDEHLRGRNDYIRATKKDSSNEKKVNLFLFI